MKRLIEFSDKSVELAKAAKLLGFNTIQKYGTVNRANSKEIPHVRMLNAKTSCELNASFFPELEIGEEVDVNYIISFRECNELYKKIGADKYV